MSLASRVEQLQSLCRNHDLEGLLAIFSVDASLCGEGAPTIVQGASQLREALIHMLELTPELTITLQQEQSVSADTAVTWLHWKSPCQGQDIEFRSLTVWRNQNGNWQIVADMYGMGAFQS